MCDVSKHNEFRYPIIPETYFLQESAAAMCQNIMCFDLRSSPNFFFTRVRGGDVSKNNVFRHPIVTETYFLQQRFGFVFVLLRRSETGLANSLFFVYQNEAETRKILNPTSSKINPKVFSRSGV